MSVAASTPATKSKLTPNQIKGFLAAWGGWTLDGMDAFIYALVLVPALRELLPNSGIEPTPGNIGFYGSVLFALFLFGWGVSMVWGPIADRFGRVTALMLTILTYSIFTFLCAFAQTVWQLAFLRVLCGIGIGGEQPMGGTFIAEQMPEDRRKFAAGLMHTGYYFGFFLAAAANFFIGANFGWRWMFALGGLPALMVFWIMKEVQEPEKWKQQAQRQRPGMVESFARLFTPEYKKRTIVMSTLFLVSIIGLWAGSVYVPTAVTQIAQRPEYGYSPADAARLASYASGLLAIATIVGCLAAPVLAERIGRKTTMSLYFAVMLIGISLGFGYVFYLPAALPLFFVFVVILGIGGANFAMYTLWIPEQYTTDCRGSAIGFISSIGRFVGVAMVFLVGGGIASYGSLGVPVALTAIAFVLGLLAIPAALETRGKPLPA